MTPSRLLQPVDRLVGALSDPMRREHTVIGVLVAYAVIWTLYGVIAKAGQDVHFDMVELVAWAREPALGYSKHPPLAAWIVLGWFTLFPVSDWAYYLLAITTITLALWVSWRIAARYLDGEKRVVALAMLTLTPFFNFHALKFNPNTVLILLWALTTLWFIRSFETRNRIDAALAGVGAAACMLGKYWSIFLLAGLGLAALLDSRRGVYFRSAAPWITIAVGALVLAPHVVWLISNEFPSFGYALAVHAQGSVPNAAVRVLGYLAGGAAYVALPVLVLFAAVQPGRAALADALMPPTPERQLAAAAFWGPLLLPAVFAPIFGIAITSIWTMSAWTLLPVVLLSSPLIVISRLAAVRIVTIAMLVPLVFLAASPLIAVMIHRAGVEPPAAHYSLLAEQVARVWKEATDRPLRYVGGDTSLSYGTAFYLPDRPSTFLDIDRRLAPWIERMRVERAGIVLVCPHNDVGCIRKVDAFSGASTGPRKEVELSRNFFGITGPVARYAIFAVPPRGN